MAAGQARALHAQTGRRVIIRDRKGAIREHEIWLHNPYIVRRADRPFKPVEMVNGPSVRPYIASKNIDKWTWREWACPVGEIFFSADERSFGEQNAGLLSRAVVIEPNVKQKASPNKDWGRERWMALASLLRSAGMQPVQLGPVGTQVIAGARLVETPNFRLACAVLSRARAAVLPEGGLHHAAAALNVPSVVIFGAYIAPSVTGYKRQRNLFTGSGAGCGMRIPCQCCVEAMARITPALVMEEVRQLLA